MIVKRFTIDDTGTEIALHPAVSVLTNITSAERSSILRSLGYVFLGGDASSTTEVEVNGELLLLSPAMIQNFGLAGLNVDPVVTSEDIFRALHERAAENSTPTFDPRALNVEDFLRSTPQGIYPELDQCRREYSQFMSGRKEYAQHVNELSILYRDAERKYETAVNSLAMAKKILRTPVKEDHVVQDAKFPFEQQLELMRQQEAILVEKIKDFKDSDAVRFAELVNLCREEARDMANMIADEIERLVKLIASSERALGEKGMSVELSLAEYTSAKDEVERLERKLAGPQVSPESKARLEEVHRLIANIEETPKKNVGQLEQLIAEQNFLLEQMGFPTWTSYLMADQVAAADPLTVQELQEAREKFKGAEERWLRVAAEVQSLEGYLEAIESLQEFIATTRLLLGVPPNEEVETERLVRVLRASIVSLGEETDLVRELESAFVAFGMPVPPNHDVRALIQAGEDFLSRDSSTSVLSNLNRDLSNLKQSMETLQSQIKLIEEQSFDTAQEIISHIGQMNENVKIAETEKNRLMEELYAKQELFKMYEKGILKTQRRINEIVLVLAESDFLSKHVPVVEENEVRSPEALLRSYLLQRFASVRDVGAAGSFPLIFDEPFLELDDHLVMVALDEIGRYSQGVQSILMTDSQLVGSWALQAGPIQAEIVSPSPLPATT